MYVSGQSDAPVALLLGKELWYPLSRGWVGPRAGLDIVEKR